jgi:hypothetical protein
VKNNRRSEHFEEKTETTVKSQRPRCHRDQSEAIMKHQRSGHYENLLEVVMKRRRSRHYEDFSEVIMKHRRSKHYEQRSMDYKDQLEESQVEPSPGIRDKAKARGQWRRPLEEACGGACIRGHRTEAEAP